jgi:putative RNA 2'-phosphotransferase
MTSKQQTKIGRYLCFMLRHDPTLLDAHGWAKTSAVVAVLQQQFAGINLASVRKIVAEDTKNRYSFNQTGDRIRCNQGHSVAVDLQLVPVQPPEQLFHGTARKSEWLIRRDGLLPMSRQYVHLSSDGETANVVGRRHGEPLVLTVQSGIMFRDGHVFYLSANGVWLCDQVSPVYLEFPL